MMRKSISFILLASFCCLSQALRAQDAEGFTPLKDGISFLAIGDFGRHGFFTQKEVARDMGEVSHIFEPNFIISVGDNFYPTGVESTQDHQWFTSFENIYTHHLLYENWYVALGNHDYEGNAQAQIDYSKISRRWTMPDRYYDEKIPLEDGSYLHLIVLDTNPFVSKYHKNPAKYRGISQQDTAAQVRWLEKTLSDRPADVRWTIVVGHHPLYSGGKRQAEKETLEMEARFEQIFNEHKIDAYICGHEHDMQIIKRDDAVFTQFLSGSGSELRPTGYGEGIIYAASEPGFMLFNLDRDHLNVYVVRSGEDTYSILYTYKIKK